MQIHHGNTVRHAGPESNDPPSLKLFRAKKHIKTRGKAFASETAVVGADFKLTQPVQIFCDPVRLP